MLCLFLTNRITCKSFSTWYFVSIEFCFTFFDSIQTEPLLLPESSDFEKCTVIIVIFSHVLQVVTWQSEYCVLLSLLARSDGWEGRNPWEPIFCHKKKFFFKFQCNICSSRRMYSSFKLFWIQFLSSNSAYFSKETENICSTVLLRFFYLKLKEFLQQPFLEWNFISKIFCGIEYLLIFLQFTEPRSGQFSLLAVSFLEIWETVWFKARLWKVWFYCDFCAPISSNSYFLSALHEVKRDYYSDFFSIHTNWPK